MDHGGTIQCFGQVRPDVPGRSAFGFFGPRPNPVGGNLVVSFSLATREPARLELIDVTGLRVLDRDLTGIGAGGHVPDLGDSGRHPAGIYLVRITQEGRRVSGKAAIVH